MNNSHSNMTKEQFKGLKQSYESVLNGEEKMWLFTNEGEPFDREKENRKFIEGLTSKAVKKMEEEINNIYGS